MASRYLRICSSCGKEEMTFSKVSYCNECFLIQKKKDQLAAEKDTLTKLGYTVIGDESYDHIPRRCYTVINPNCGHQFTSRYDGMTNVIKRTGVLTCGVCGKRENMKVTLKKYVERYGRDYDISVFEDYRKVVRRLSELMYKENKQIINPLNGTRNKNTYHLDHKVPIAICFRAGVAPENAASLDNLELLFSTINLQKSWYSYDADLLKKLGGNIEDKISLGLSSMSNVLKEAGLHVLLRGNSLVIDDIFTVSIISDDVHINDTFNGKKLKVREYELLEKPEQIMSRIMHKLNLHNTRIYARTLHISAVNASIAKSFCDHNHLQKHGNSTFKYGLYDNDELVALMTFGKPRFSNTAEWELIRYCTAPNVTVVGGASKLLKHFVKTHTPKNILSYADARWSDGNLYEKIGFSKIKNASSFFYVNDSSERISRYQAQKAKLETLLKEQYDPNLSEHENMRLAGYKRVNEPGQHVYFMSLT